MKERGRDEYRSKGGQNDLVIGVFAVRVGPAYGYVGGLPPNPLFLLVLWSCVQFQGTVLYKLDALTKVHTPFDWQTGSVFGLVLRRRGKILTSKTLILLDTPSCCRRGGYSIEERKRDGYRTKRDRNDLVIDVSAVRAGPAYGYAGGPPPKPTILAGPMVLRSYPRCDAG